MCWVLFSVEMNYLIYGFKNFSVPGVLELDWNTYVLQTYLNEALRNLKLVF